MSIGEKLKELRENAGKTQVAVAKDLEISLRAYCSYEQNQRIPRDPLKKKIAKYYDTSVQAIFF